jgi:P2-related tail formation protein
MGALKMIKISDYKTETAFPAEMKTIERMALAYAYDRQKKLFLERMKRVYIWADLDNVDENKLDFLAVECRVLFYNSSLSPDVKRKLIQNSIYWYMKLGTRQAMEEMIDIVFGNENTNIEEWYTYAGEAFHFRVVVGTTVTQTSIKEFLLYLNQVKNARSRFDYLVFQNGISLTIYQRSEYEKFVYTFCGDYECGTYPGISVAFQPVEVTLTLEGDSIDGRTDYTESGTTPDISVGGAVMENRIDIQPESLENNIVYSTDSETESGTTPDISVAFEKAESQIEIEPESLENNIVYSADGETESGTTPDISTGFQGSGSEINIDPAADSGRTAYEESGTYPDISSGFQGSEGGISIDADADTGRTAYEETGTYPNISVAAQFNEVQAAFEIDSAGNQIDYPSDGETESGTTPDPAVGFVETESGVSVLTDGAGHDLYYSTDADKYAADE